MEMRLQRWWVWVVGVPLCGGQVVAAPRIDWYEPAAAVRGEQVALHGDGLDAAYAVYLKNWRGDLVPAEVLQTQPDRVLIEIPEVLTRWSSGYRTEVLVLTPEGATHTMPADTVTVTGTVSAAPGASAYYVADGGALNVGGEDSNASAFYVAAGGALYSSSGSGGHLYIVENGGLLDFSGGGGGHLCLFGENALVSGLSIQHGVNGFVVPDVGPSFPAATLQVFPIPIFISDSSASGLVGRGFSHEIQLEPLPEELLSLTAEGLPPGLELLVNPFDGGTIFGEPQQPGEYTVTVIAENAYGASTQEVHIAILDLGIPTITSPFTVAASRSEPFAFSISATESPNHFAAQGLPAGLTIDEQTGVISGTPSDPGAYAVTLFAANDRGVGEATLTILVDQAPTRITGFSPDTCVPGDVLTVYGEGFTGTTAVYVQGYGSELFTPPFVVQDDTALDVTLPTMTFYGDFRDDFVFKVVVVSTAGSTVTVPPNHGVLASGTGSLRSPLTMVEAGATYDATTGGSLVVYLKSGATGLIGGGGGGLLFFVEDGAVLNAQPSGGGGNNYFVSPGAQVNGNVGVIRTTSFRPSYMDVMPRVLPAPEIHAFDAPPGEVGQPYTYGLFIMQWPEGENLTVSAEGLPPGLELDDDTQTIQGIPTLGGIYEVTVTATDSFGPGRATFEIVIADSLMPNLLPVEPVIVDVDQPIQIWLQAINGAEWFGADDLPNGLTLNPLSGEIFGASSAAGTYDFTVRAGNAFGADEEPARIVVGSTPLAISALPEFAGEGTWMDVEGRGFSTVTSAYLWDSWRAGLVNAGIDILSDRHLRVQVPMFLFPESVSSRLLLVADQGAIVTMSPESLDVTGSITAEGGLDYIVRGGGNLPAGGTGRTTVFVEDGGAAAADRWGDLLLVADGGQATAVGGGPTVVHAHGAQISGNPGSSLEVSNLSYALLPPIQVGYVPEFSSHRNPSAYLGLPFAYQLSLEFGATGVVAYAADPLPPGLVIDPATGLISGRPSAIGDFATWLDVELTDGHSSTLITVSVKDPYVEWRDLVFAELPGGSFNPLADLTADADGDRLTNIAEYALVADPLSETRPGDLLWAESNPASPAASSKSGAKSSHEGPVFAFRRIKADGMGNVVDGYVVGDVRYEPMVSFDLTHWQSGPGVLEAVGDPVDNQDGSETVRVRCIAPERTVFFGLRIVKGAAE